MIQTALLYLALFSLVPVIFVLFACLPPRRAVIYSFLWGWLFLPIKAFPIHGFTEYSKVSATPLAVLLAALIFDAERVFAVRPKLWDIPMLLYTICPFFSSIHNGLGVYDGGNATVNQFFLWTGGYVVGRIYFTDLEGLKELAYGFILGGLLYVPLCLFEVRMSPMLNLKIYGFNQHSSAQTHRLGGYRPMVFLQHGIALGMWMAAATMCAIWLWVCGAFKQLWSLPAWFWVLALLGTTILCRVTGGVVLMVVGLVVLMTVKWPKTRLAVLALVIVPPVYTYARARHLWTGENLVQYAAKFNQDRADSLAFRLRNEDLLIARAKESPVFGWGGWGRFQAKDESGRDIAIPDQQWVIALGKTGVIGVASFEAALLLPILILLLRVPIRYWAHPAVAPAAVLAVIVTLHLWDCLENAMVNPLFMIACGGLTGMLPVRITFAPRRQAAAGRPAGAMQGMVRRPALGI